MVRYGLKSLGNPVEKAEYDKVTFWSRSVMADMSVEEEEWDDCIGVIPTPPLTDIALAL